MTEQKLINLIKIFYSFNLKNHGLIFYPYQQEIIERSLRAIFMQNGEELAFEISRQAGKTEAIVSVVEFGMIFYPELFGKPLRVGIFAPQKEQAKTDFDRLKEKLTKTQYSGFQEAVDPEESNSVTLQLSNGSYCYIFPLTSTSHPESKTLDVIIYEESNKINDHEKAVKSDPMGTATNACRISVGVAGFQKNFFKRLSDKPECLKVPAERVIEQKRQAYEKDGNEFHLNYERFVTSYLNDHGEDNDAYRTQYKLEWILGVGQFITPEALTSIRGNFGLLKTTSAPVVVGIDTAKSPDKTIVTVKNMLPIKDENGMVIRPKSILSWLRLKGDNYKDQFDTICSFLRNFSNIEAIAIDSTGQGDFMPDMFERETGYQIIRVKFSLQSKDVIYKNLIQQVKLKATLYPDVDCLERREFEEELLDLQKEYKGEYLSCHHPNDAKAHDDYADSWALAEYAEMWLAQNGVDVDVISIPTIAVSPQEDELEDLVV